MTAPGTLPLFVYGSLRDPTVRACLLGTFAEKIATSPAALHGHAIQRAAHFEYPLLAPAAPDARVDGELLLGIDDGDLEIFDAYEDVEDGLYVRAAVTVHTASGPRGAWVYLKGPAAPPLA